MLWPFSNQHLVQPAFMCSSPLSPDSLLLHAYVWGCAEYGGEESIWLINLGYPVFMWLPCIKRWKKARIYWLRICPICTVKASNDRSHLNNTKNTPDLNSNHVRRGYTHHKMECTIQALTHILHFMKWVHTFTVSSECVCTYIPNAAITKIDQSNSCELW